MVTLIVIVIVVASAGINWGIYLAFSRHTVDVNLEARVRRQLEEHSECSGVVHGTVGLPWTQFFDWVVDIRDCRVGKVVEFSVDLKELVVLAVASLIVISLLFHELLVLQLLSPI